MDSQVKFAIFAAFLALFVMVAAAHDGMDDDMPGMNMPAMAPSPHTHQHDGSPTNQPDGSRTTLPSLMVGLVALALSFLAF